MIQTFTLLGMLGFCTIEDCRKKRILLCPVLLFGIAGLILHLYYRNITIYSLLAGCLIGAFLLLISKVTGGKIGIGDGLVLIVTGIYLGFENNTILFLHGLFFCGIWSLLMLLTKKKKGSDEVPFVPFLLLAYVKMLLL